MQKAIISTNIQYVVIIEPIINLTSQYKHASIYLNIPTKHVNSVKLLQIESNNFNTPKVLKSFTF